MRYLFRAFAGSLCSLAVIASSTPARANLITDGGFETTQLGAGNYQYVNGTLNGWVYSFSNNYADAGVLIAYASNSAWMDSAQTGFGGNQVAGVKGLGGISQSFSATASGTYAVTWVDAGRGGGFGGNGSQTYTASLYDNTTSLAVASTVLNTVTGSIFNAEEFAASLNAGDVYTLAFTGQISSADETALIDNVSVAQVPEPAALGLFGAGLAGLGLTRRRRTT